jgi:hypothetical protein
VGALPVRALILVLTFRFPSFSVSEAE